MIDTHCHLTDPRLHSQLDAVLARASQAGVTHVLTIGTGLADSRRCVDLCGEGSQVRCAVGIHPHEAARVQSDDVEAVRELCGRRPVVALGEMGLDYHYDFSDRASQRRVFEQQAALAARAGLPVVIHCRQAVADTLAVLRASGVARGVFHCFTGSNDEATSIIDAGFLLGFTGIVTFKGSDELRRIAGSIPADRLLLETDAPYLSPEPVRRQRTNEPANVMHTLACVARLRQTDPAALDQAVRANASALFGWP